MNHQLPSSLILSPSRFSQSRSYFQFTLLIPYTAPPIGDYQYFNVNKPTAGFHSLYFVPYFPPHCIWVFQERLMYRGHNRTPQYGSRQSIEFVFKYRLQPNWSISFQTFGTAPTHSHYCLHVGKPINCWNTKMEQLHQSKVVFWIDHVTNRVHYDNLGWSLSCISVFPSVLPSVFPSVLWSIK